MEDPMEQFKKALKGLEKLTLPMERDDDLSAPEETIDPAKAKPAEREQPE